MPIRKKLEAEDEAEDDRFVMMRAEDRSIWSRSAYLLEKYKVIVWFIAILSIAIGFQFKTPAMIVNDLQGQINSNKAVVDRVIIPRVDSMETKLDLMLKFQCLDQKISPEQRALLDCRRLLNQ